MAVNPKMKTLTDQQIIRYTNANCCYILAENQIIHEEYGERMTKFPKNHTLQMEYIAEHGMPSLTSLHILSYAIFETQGVSLSAGLSPSIREWFWGIRQKRVLWLRELMEMVLVAPIELRWVFFFKKQCLLAIAQQYRRNLGLDSITQSPFTLTLRVVDAGFVLYHTDPPARLFGDLAVQAFFAKYFEHLESEGAAGDFAWTGPDGVLFSFNFELPACELALPLKH